jgi:hypothetical protein
VAPTINVGTKRGRPSPIRAAPSPIRAAEQVAPISR